jgi:acetyl esterase/lipase
MPTEELTPENTVDPSGAYKSYKWSEARWQEPSLQCMWVGHEFVFVPAVDYRSKPAHPTIVYFHPNTLKHTFEKNSPISNNVAKVAVAAGFNFISVEYRHPVTDQYLAYYNNNKIHHQDVGLFMQFLRGNAAKMRISKNNIFSFGYSRGSLALWQALQPDMGGGNTGKPSSLVSAFVGYQAQSTYQCSEYGVRFLDPLHQGTEPSIQMCEETNWWHPQFGSALFDLNPLSAIPVRLQYQSERGFELQEPKSQWIVKKVSYPYLVANYEPDHYPNFGAALYRLYLDYGISHMMPAPVADIPVARQFEGWLDFVAPLVKPNQP